MNTNKDSAVQCMIIASYILSSMCTIFIFLAIFKRSWNMGLIALDSFLIMGAILISAFIINDCEEYNDVPFLVNIICCIVLAIEYFIIIVSCGIFNIVILQNSFLFYQKELFRLLLIYLLQYF